MSNDTAKRLSELTDEGLFERLATAVLREGDQRYSALAHLGVNAEGKTVKSPVDGLSFIPGSDPPHLVAAHHTITKAIGLPEKWLHDPRTVKSRKGKPTAPSGDVVKTAEIVAQERLREPRLLATLALTTNNEPSKDLYLDVHAAGRKLGIEIDIWSRSRIADFLDSPKGQWLRHQYLGIEQQRISRELLAKLSRDSLAIFRPPGDDPEVWVDRSIDEALSGISTDVSLIIADAGLGKSVAAYKQLRSHVERGGFGMVVQHDVIAKALNPVRAIDYGLKALHPHLAPDAGADALQLCEASLPFLMVVEDINRSGQASELLEKITNWSQHDSNKIGLPWRLICGAWPRATYSLKDTIRKRVNQLTVLCPAMSEAESRVAIQRRAARQKRPVSALEADAIATALGRDPLLIGLHDFNEKPDAQAVIARFIEHRLDMTATGSSYTISDLRLGLLALAEGMLGRRTLEPTWTELSNWFDASNSTLPSLRALVKQEELIRLPSGSDRLAFRHDRVRDYILATAFASQVHDGSLTDDLRSDPYFAEMLGYVASLPETSDNFIDDLERSNPLALFYALSRVPNPEIPRHATIVSTILRWLSNEENRGKRQAHLRWHALQILAQIESPQIIEIVNGFPNQGWDGLAARFRNGDLSGGIGLVDRLDPGMNDPWRDLLMEHVKLRFGPNLITALDTQLRRADVQGLIRLGLLRLAGLIADDLLGGAIEASWNADVNRDQHLADYLISASYCCGTQPEQLLEPICDAWAALPDKAEKEEAPSAKDDLAAFSARFAFQRRPPNSAIGFLIQRAASEDLRWPITYLLHEVDHPDALEFIARELALTAARLEGTGSFSPFAASAADRWSRQADWGLPPMSADSKGRLLDIWIDPNAGKHLREHAFRLWAASQAPGDLKILQNIAIDDPLCPRALFARLMRGDHSAIPALVEKLREGDEFYWWQAGRHLWSDSLTAALDESLTRRSTIAERSWNQTPHNSDWMTSEMFTRLPVPEAERLLLKHWDHLHYSAHFIHVALYTATPALTRLISSTMAECPSPREAMKHIDRHYGIKQKGRGLTRLAQVESLVPYLDLLSEFSAQAFAEACNEQGWFDFRRKHLDVLLKNTRYATYLSEDQIFESLDQDSERSIRSMDLWVRRYMEFGASIDEVMCVIAKWLNSRRTMTALVAVSDVVGQFGYRRHMHILEQSVEPTAAFLDIVADTRFAVMRRTLN